MAAARLDISDALAVPDEARAVIDALEQAGFEAWVVGGFVRDCLLGTPPADVDVASSAPWRKAQAVFHGRGWRTHETGTAHGTLQVVVGDQAIEVTTYRSDGPYEDARHPKAVTFVRTIEEDLARRDFTMNALAYHPQRGLVDPYGGLDDLRAGVIRAVGDPNKRFREDALRTLRGCRFASELGFAIESVTYKGMNENKGLLELVSRERVRHELECLLTGPHAGDAILRTVDVLSAVLPELVAMKGFDQHSPYHIYDVLEHTARVVDNVPRQALVRWAALFHDMGKPATFFLDDRGIGHFYRHPVLSARMAAGALERLGMGRRFSSRVVALVEHHDDRIAADAGSVRRLLARMGGDVELTSALFDLQRGDAAGQAPRCADRVALMDELQAILREVACDDVPYTTGGLAIDGEAVMALGVPRGPQVGAALQAALDAVLDGQAENTPESLGSFVRSWLE